MRSPPEILKCNETKPYLGESSALVHWFTPINGVEYTAWMMVSRYSRECWFALDGCHQVQGEAQLSSPMIRVRSLSRDYKELAILSNQGAVVLSENDSGSG